MRCADFEDRVEALALDAVDDPEARRALLDHATGCPACGERLDAERRFDGRIRAAMHSPVPDGLAALIEARLAAAPTIEAPPTATPRRWPWIALAAAAVLFAAMWRPAPTIEARADAVAGRVTLDDRRTLTSTALAAGQRLTTGANGAAVIHLADATVWIDPDSEVVVAALERGADALLSLRRGRLRAVVGPGAPFIIDTAHGRVSTPSGALEVRVIEKGDSMSAKPVLIALGAAAAAAVVYVAVQSGQAEVVNGEGKAAVAAGQSGAAASDTAPARLPPGDRVTALEAQVERLRRERDVERAKVKRLEARVETLAGKVGKDAEGPIELRPTAEVRADLAELMKSEGVKLLGLSKDNPLFKELVAMGPAGIDLLGDMLAGGDQNERFGAAALMELIGDADALPLLEKAIFSGDNAENLLVQRMASHAVGKIGGEQAVPVLERIVSEGSEWGVRTNAAYGLAEMGRQSGIDWLRDSYRTLEDPMARMAILGAMSQIGDPSYLPDLHTVLREETEYSKRYIAVTGIAKAAREESLPVLEAIIDDPNEDKMIIAEARKALDEIKGQD